MSNHINDDPVGDTTAAEIRALRQSLADANKAALAAAADTATARLVLRMAVDQHEREVKALKRTIGDLFSAIEAQAIDLERLASSIVAGEYAEPVRDKAPGRADDDWFMPGGLPRGVR